MPCSSRGEQVRSSLFPFGPTMVTMVVELGGGRSIEVASIGREGAVGGIVSCGHAPAFSRAEVLVGGQAFSVPMQALEDAKERSPFIGNMFCRYSDYLLVDSHAVGRLQRLPLDHRARRALAAACAGPRRRPHRADPGSLGRPCSACSARPSTP